MKIRMPVCLLLVVTVLLLGSLDLVWSADSSGPVIINVDVIDQCIRAQQFKWDTTKPTKCQLQWGLDSSALSGDTSLIEDFYSGHSLLLEENLSIDTCYFFRITCTDESGNSSVYRGTFTITKSGTITTSIRNVRFSHNVAAKNPTNQKLIVSRAGTPIISLLGRSVSEKNTVNSASRNSCQFGLILKD